MANGFGSFYIGSSGLQSAQNALNVVSNNLSNVDTTGYVRQQVIFSDKSYSTLKNTSNSVNMQQSGLGVSIGDVVHARDLFLDKAYRQERGREAFYSNSYEVVSQVEDLFQELYGEELKNTLSDLRTGFQQLAANPEDSTKENVVIQQSEILLGRFQALYSDLKSYQQNLNDQVKETVDTINDLGERIYELNLYVQKVEAGGIETAMTARDERDALLDELSSYVNISCTEDSSGFVTVKVEGTEFVAAYGTNPMDVQTDLTTGFYTPYWVRLSNTEQNKYSYVYKNLSDISTASNTDIGKLRSLLFQRGDHYGTYADYESSESYAAIEDSTLVETQASFDVLFHTIATTINDILCPNISAGENTTIASALANNGGTLTVYDSYGDQFEITADTKILDAENCSVGSDGKLPPQELFTRLGCDRYTEVTDAAGNTYYLYNEESETDTAKMYSITGCEVNLNLRQQESLLPVFTANGSVDYAMGNKLQQAWDEGLMTVSPNENTPYTFEGYYDTLIDRIGTNGNIYYDSMTTLDTTVTSLDNSRQQIMGVSSDEELTNMIRYQAAYNAASRYITVISEMTELICTGLI